MPEKQYPSLHQSQSQSMPEQKKHRIMERLWLNYYNDALYAQGVITEDERNKMRIKIKARGASIG